MLFLVRISSWLLLSSVLMFYGGCYYVLGGYLENGWLFGLFIIATNGIIWGLAFILDHLRSKWNSLGLRYARYAKEDGGANHAEKAAKYYFLKSALFRDGNALINLGLCYAEGFGVEKDLVKAVKCYKMVAKYSSVAKLALGSCYAEGLGVDKDLVKTEDLYKTVDGNFDVGYYWNSIDVIMWM